MIDQLPHDQIPVLEHSTDIVIGRVSPLDSYGIIRPNSLYPPFNNPKAREALALIVSQREYTSAAFGDKRWWRECWSFFVCGSADGTEAGSENFRHQDLARAKALLAEAGYKGEKIIMLTTQEIPSLAALGDVTADNLRKIGVNLDIAVSDWGTMVARRAKKDPPGQGGWNLFHTTVGGTSMSSPLANFTINSSLRRQELVRLAMRRQDRRIALGLYPRRQRGRRPGGARGAAPAAVAGIT